MSSANLLSQLLPLPPRDFEAEPEVSLLTPQRLQQKQQQQQQQWNKKKAQLVYLGSERKWGVRIREAWEQNEYDEVDIQAKENKKQHFEQEYMNSSKRLTGDSSSCWSSDRSGNIFLRSQRETGNERANYYNNDNYHRGAEEEEASNAIKSFVSSPTAEAAAAQSDTEMKPNKSLNNCHKNHLHQLPFQTTTPIIGRLKRHSKMAAIWTRQTPMSKNFISLSATSVCLLSTTIKLKLLLQLVLIMMLIMIPLTSVFKCPSVVLVAMAAHQNHQSADITPNTRDTNNIIASTAAATTRDDKIRLNSQNPSSSPSIITPYKTTKLPTTNKLLFNEEDDDAADDNGRKTTIERQLYTSNFEEIGKNSKIKVSKLEQQESSITEGAENEINNKDRSKAGSVASGGTDRKQRFKRSYDQQQQPLGCNQYSAFWNFFRATYPSLASHLFSLATTTNGEDGPMMVVQTTKTISRLLEEAERIVSEQQQHQKPTLANVATNKPTSAASAWLARVKANPLYNRIIQHFQNQHRHLADRHHTQNFHDLATSANNNNQPEQQLEGDQKQRDSSSSSVPLPLQTSDSGHVYGRVIHFPHEANNKASKTVDKLKQLNKQQMDNLVGSQQQQPRQQINEIDRLSAGATSSLSDEIESNRIPLVAGDGNEQWPPRQLAGRFDTEGDADSARNKYVYGDVLLRPSQKNVQGIQHSTNNHHHRHSSLGALRQLSDDLDRSMRLDEQQPGDDDNNKNKLSMQQHNNNEPMSHSESYGRVLVSPPSLTDRTTIWENNNNQKAATLSSSASQLAANSDTGSDTMGPSGGLNELAAQQYGGSVVAANAPEEPGSEFEGVWYSGPLPQIEVRQLRSGSENADRSKAEPEVVVVHTTSNPKQAIVVD